MYITLYLQPWPDGVSDPPPSALTQKNKSADFRTAFYRGQPPAHLWNKRAGLLTSVLICHTALDSNEYRQSQQTLSTACFLGNQPPPLFFFCWFCFWSSLNLFPSCITAPVAVHSKLESIKKKKKKSQYVSSFPVAIELSVCFEEDKKASERFLFCPFPITRKTGFVWSDTVTCKSRGKWSQHTPATIRGEP